MRHARLALVLIVLPAMAGCVSDGRGIASAPPWATPAPVGVNAVSYGGPVPVAQVVIEPASTAYTLDSGDRLRVVVFGQEGLTNSYAVDTAGNITIPLIGPVRARALSTTETYADLVARLLQGFLPRI